MRANVYDVASHIKSGLVLDVGGGLCPFPLADITFDLKGGDVTGDVCITPWPFATDTFEFVVCTQTLEDLRDPIVVCKEMQRVGRAGYIEVPSWKLELSQGHDKMTFASYNLSHGIGYPHHRWIVLKEEDGLVFTFKFPYPYLLPKLFILPEVLVEEVLFLGFFWENKFSVRELFLTTPQEVEEWYQSLGILQI